MSLVGHDRATVEQDALEYLETRRDDLVELARRLIAAPSPNPPGDERAVAAVVRRAAIDLGLGEPKTLAAREERPNLRLCLPGRVGRPRLVLNGHLDTKPVGDRSAWRTDPFEGVVQDGRLYGLGSTDMKGAVTAMLYAAAALKANGADLRGDLILLLSADEEAGSRYGAQFLVRKAGLAADAVVIGEPSGIRREWEYLDLLSRGNCCFRIKVHGTQMHSSITDVLPAVNASVKMARVMVRMSEELKLRYPPHPLRPEGPTLNPGVTLRGGVFYGVCPGYAEFGADLRTLPGMTLEGVRTDIQRFLETLREEDPDLHVELEFEEPPLRWIEPTEIDRNHPVVRSLARAAKRVLGTAPPFSALPGTTDAAYFQGTGRIPTVPAFGPGLLPIAHGPNEYVGVEAIVQASKIYALAAMDFLATEPAAGKMNAW
jgi:acetylornithine deacetylase/succinyl-diaminopimelate desuccinylase family protein